MTRRKIAPHEFQEVIDRLVEMGSLDILGDIANSAIMDWLVYDGDMLEDDLPPLETLEPPTNAIN